jgi:L-seryl-tRNA(Ser) seleniumtransferase
LARQTPDGSHVGELFRSIPSVDFLLSDPAFSHLIASYSGAHLKRGLRRALDSLRNEIASGKAGLADCAPAAISERAAQVLTETLGPTLKTVINATGVIVHTNLGRSPLSTRVVDRIVAVATSYSNLEYDLDAGRRGERNAHLRSLMTELTGAEDAMAVNNNAAAVLLALSELASGREVIVSRGELIEIGGAFRIPDVMARSGAILREVGTTNRTHPRDYRDAINERTALILKVHPSNYRIEGFTREVELQELTEIGRFAGIPTMMDLGSGCLVDLAPYGLPGETTVQETLAKGVDLVSFSGDKLLGGPQAGVLAGKSALIDRIRRNPLARALRMDKLTLAALEGTLLEYLRPEGPRSGVPTLDMIMRRPEELHEIAQRMAEEIRSRVGSVAVVSLESGYGRVGGGALPLGELQGPRVAVRPLRISVASLGAALRRGDPPVVGVIRDDAFLLDPRTLSADEAKLIPGLLACALSGGKCPDEP